jgi:hypothetical protein
MSLAQLGISKTETHKINMSKKIYVYYHDSKSIYKEFNSCSDVAKYFECARSSVSYYLDKENKIYKKIYILSSKLLS